MVRLDNLFSGFIVIVALRLNRRRRATLLRDAASNTNVQIHLFSEMYITMGTYNTIYKSVIVYTVQYNHIIHNNG